MERIVHIAIEKKTALVDWIPGVSSDPVATKSYRPLAVYTRRKGFDLLIIDRYIPQHKVGIVVYQGSIFAGQLLRMMHGLYQGLEEVWANQRKENGDEDR